MKIIADQQISYVAQAFSELAEVTLCNGREITAESIHEADVLLVRSVTPIDANLLEGSQVKFVASATSGQNHIDSDYLQRNSIGFADAKGSNARSVAEYVLSSLFVLADQHDFKLKEKTVGVIGCGEVGSRVVDMLETMGVQTIMNDPPLKDAIGNNASIGDQYRDLQEVLLADIVTLHVPLTEDGFYPTQQMVNSGFLDKLNDDVILLNTSRGSVIDEMALRAHIESHHNMKVVLDVWGNEPDIDTDLLTHTSIGTPHIAGYSIDAKLRATEMIFRSMCEFFQLDAAWQAVTELPDENMPELNLNADVDDEDAIQIAVLASYDVRGDSEALRCLPEINIEQRGRYFDELRENYPVRREFPAMVIKLSESKKALAEKLRQLGFNVKLTS
ncbi:MAG: 4-phosphoerythronate dehydrogenase [Gammaproteobacteria bacterium]